MKINFSKYQAAGNDFVLIDARNIDMNEYNSDQIQRICSRRLGIGADGIIFLCPSSQDDHDFRMRYLNADGGEVNMCGNGLRAITHFAFKKLNLLPRNKNDNFYRIELPKGIYQTKFIAKNDGEDEVKVEMSELYDWGKWSFEEIQKITRYSEMYNTGDYLNTGVPHVVLEVNNLEQCPVVEEGKNLRYNLEHFPQGTNVNFYSIVRASKVIAIRTYERGVEDETYACGTGVTAVGLSLTKRHGWSDLIFETRGGRLKFDCSKDFTQVFLQGPVENTFDGQISSTKGLIP